MTKQQNDVAFSVTVGIRARLSTAINQEVVLARKHHMGALAEDLAELAELLSHAVYRQQYRDGKR